MRRSLVFLAAILNLIANTLGSVIFADLGMSSMVELNVEPPFCKISYDRGLIQNAVLSLDSTKVRQMSNNLVADLVKTCNQFNNSTTSTKGIIYPGTKWCGPDDIAESENDFGRHAAEDACCREHDRCESIISPGECIHGICNNSPYIRSHCDCDAKLRRCLQGLNTEVANALGAYYFNVIQIICFMERRPCTKWQRSGYTERQSDRVCSQYKFRPSDKYVPMMPLDLH